MISLADEHRVNDVVLSAVGPMWPALLQWARQAMLGFDPPLANPDDLTIPRCAASADEAIAIIRAHHATWLDAQPPKG